MKTTLAGICRNLADHESRVRAMVSAHSECSLNRNPAAGGWNALQCIEHLTITNRLLASAIETALPSSPPGHETPTDEISPGPLWRLLLALVEPEVRLKGFAPAKLKPANSVSATAAVLRQYFESHEALRTLASKCNGLDLNRKRLRHPILRLRMSIGAVYLLIAAHERRHLAQAERTVLT